MTATPELPAAVAPTPVPEPLPTPVPLPTPTPWVQLVYVTPAVVEPTPWVLELIATPTPGDTPTPVVVVVTATPTQTPTPTVTPVPTETPTPTPVPTATPVPTPSPTPTRVPTTLQDFAGIGPYISDSLAFLPNQVLRAEIVATGAGVFDAAFVSPGGCVTTAAPRSDAQASVMAFRIVVSDICQPSAVVQQGAVLIVRTSALVSWTVRLTQEPFPDRLLPPRTLEGVGTNVTAPLLLEERVSLRLTSAGSGHMTLTLLGMYQAATPTYQVFEWEGDLAGGVSFRHMERTGTYLPMVAAVAGRRWILEVAP